MVVKERIVVDLPFDQVAACVAKVKEWLVSKGYKKTTERHPDRWSATTVLDITKGGVFGKKNMEATFKSYMSGNSIMIEFVGSHDGQGIGGKPVIDRGQNPKDRPFSNLANELTRFVKSTWKREQGGPGDVVYTPPTPQPSTMYQYDAPSVPSDPSTGYEYGTETGYEEQPAYQQDTGYEYGTETGYQEEAAPQQDTGYQEDAPGAYSDHAMSAPEPVAQPPSGELVIPEGDISDEELAAIEAQLEAEEAAAASSTTPEASTDAPVEPVPEPEPEPTHDSEPTYDAGPEPSHDEPVPDVEPEPSHDEPVPEVGPEPSHDTAPGPDLGPTVGEEQPPAQPTCPGCGKNVKERWKTCPYCEYDLSGAPAEEPGPAPEPEGGQEAPACPTCGKTGTFIEDYQRFYCYDCENYL